MGAFDRFVSQPGEVEVTPIEQFSQAYALPNGNLMVPLRAESADVIGDGMIEVEIGTPLFEEWLPWALEEV